MGEVWCTTYRLKTWQGCRSGFFKKKLGFGDLKTLKHQKSEFQIFIACFHLLCTEFNNKMIAFVAFTRPNLCSLDLSLLFNVLVDRNFVSGICNLRLKNVKT